MPPAGFELAIATSKRPQNHASDRTATGIGVHVDTHITKTGIKKENIEVDAALIRSWI
jgi:hypothetical protein